MPYTGYMCNVSENLAASLLILAASFIHDILIISRTVVQEIFALP
jgi:hypothetical protein